MAELWKDGFDHYGGSDAAMLEGPWAQMADGTGGDVDLAIPAFGARTGTYCVRLEGSMTATGVARRVLGGDFSEIFVALGYRSDDIPTKTMAFLQFRTSANSTICSLVVNPDGSIDLRSGTFGTVLASTSGPAVVGSTWHHLEMRIVRSDTVGIFELRVDEVTVINASNLNLGVTNIGQLGFINEANGPTNVTGTNWYLDDLIVRDTTGARNNGFLGDLRIATLFPNSDTAVAGWTRRARKKFGTGILDLRGGATAFIQTADAASLELGSGDYTVEGFVRFLTLPTTTNLAQIAGKWDEGDNDRSWRLYKAGPDINSGQLVFQISTDGTAGTVVNLFEYPWEPELNRWYHVAVSRNTSVTRVFIDGVQIGLDQADANTYHDGAGVLCFGAQAESAGAAAAGTGFDGFMDELRLTVGVGRYTTDFTAPSAAFGRDVGSDPSFASVQFLAGFDSAVEDESGAARTTTAVNGAVQHTPDDGNADYESIDDSDPRDDTFMEAALIAAENILTLTANAGNLETVTIGATTYTFLSVFVDAPNNILIGATADDSLDNLLNAINNGPGEGTVYGTGTTANASATASDLPGSQMKATAITPGTGGNSIVSTETLANGSWDSGATFAGGADIPGESEFLFDPLPPETTGVRSVSIVNRGFKVDAGSSEVTVSFVGSGGGALGGTPQPMTLSPTYREDVFDTDPDTAGALTPSTFLGGRARLDRTL